MYALSISLSVNSCVDIQCKPWGGRSQQVQTHQVLLCGSSPVNCAACWHCRCWDSLVNAKCKSVWCLCAFPLYRHRHL